MGPESVESRKPSRWSKLGGICIFCAVTLVIPTGFAVYKSLANSSPIKVDPFSPASDSPLGRFRTAAVSSDGVPCSNVGRVVLADGGSAVDAAIATLFCVGVVSPQSAGIGGGFLMTIYDSKTKTARCLDALPMAPAAATAKMYSGNWTDSRKGGKSVAVPGELAGYWAAHKAYGKLPWSRLVQPAAEIAEIGVPVSSHLANVLQAEAVNVKRDPSMKRLFVNKTTGKLLQKGNIFKMPELAITLRIIARHGADAFYNGSIGKQLVEDVRRREGILAMDDLVQYRPLWADPVKVDLTGDLTLYSTPPPGSGVLLAYIMKILDGLDLRKTGNKDPLTYHRIAEAFKHSYAQRTKLGDPQFVPEVKQLVDKLISDKMAEGTRDRISNFVTSNDPKFYGAVAYQPEDHGGSHVSILDDDGMAVSVTTTINHHFGAGFVSEQTGIILNDEMNTFSVPESTSMSGLPPNSANFILPRKRPLSSMAPAVVVDSRTAKVRLVIGASGGLPITSATAYVALRYLWFNETIKEAIDSRRIHHQLLPMSLHYEPGFPEALIRNLTAIGHRRTPLSGPKAIGPAAVCGITVDISGITGIIQANSDYRKGGGVDGIDPLPGIYDRSRSLNPFRHF